MELARTHTRAHQRNLFYTSKQYAFQWDRFADRMVFNQFFLASSLGLMMFNLNKFRFVTLNKLDVLESNCIDGLIRIMIINMICLCMYFFRKYNITSFKICITLQVFFYFFKMIFNSPHNVCEEVYLYRYSFNKKTNLPNKNKRENSIYLPLSQFCIPHSVQFVLFSTPIFQSQSKRR